MKPLARRQRKTRARTTQVSPILVPVAGHHPAVGHPYPPRCYPFYYPYPYPPYHYAFSAPPPHVVPAPAPAANNNPLPPLAKPVEKETVTELRSVPLKTDSDSSPSTLVAPSNDTDAPGEGEEIDGTIVPHENDVLMGRGGKNNIHVGNERLRGMARAMREKYMQSRKKQKTDMARQLVQQVFALNPPGRFLQRNPVTMIWEEVDVDTARHKTSQCLRDAASEKPCYARLNTKEVEEEEEVVVEGETTMQIDSADIEEIIADREEPEKIIERMLTPVPSNIMAHKIEPSPLSLARQGSSDLRNRLESWESESGSIARNLIASWDDRTGSFRKPRRGSMETFGTLSGCRSMYTWINDNSEHSGIVEMDIEDAVLIPPEEFDVEDNTIFLIDDEMEPQIWKPGQCQELDSPFDTEFF